MEKPNLVGASFYQQNPNVKGDTISHLRRSL